MTLACSDKEDLKAHRVILLAQKKNIQKKETINRDLDFKNHIEYSKIMNMSPDEQKICIFNQTGFCKFKDECLNKHLDQVCEQSDCTDDVCKSLKRHPKPCKKFMNSKYCYNNENCADTHELLKTVNMN